MRTANLASCCFVKVEKTRYWKEMTRNIGEVSRLIKRTFGDCWLVSAEKRNFLKKDLYFIDLIKE